MKNNILKFIWVLGMLCSTLLFAETRSHDEMENVAVNFASIVHPDVEYAINTDVMDDVYGEEKAYSIIVLEPKGYVIVAHDDRLHPIMGFNLGDAWDAEKSLSPYFLAGLKQKSKTLTLEESEPSDVSQKKVRKSSASRPISLQSIWQTLSISTTERASTPSKKMSRSKKKPTTPVVVAKGPLLRTNWNNWDHKEFNSKTPLINLKTAVNGQFTTVHAPVGCGATAFGQVMYYHKWPHQIASTSVRYKINDHDPRTGNPRVRENIRGTVPKLKGKYDYMKSIPDLVADIGKVLGMRYTENVSYVDPAVKLQQLKKVFKYISTGFEYRKGHRSWHKNIKRDIDNGLPIIYQSKNKLKSKIGHIYVLDGYLEIKKLKVRSYHFNWDLHRYITKHGLI